LCEWAYEIYDTIEHQALSQSPREAFEMGMRKGGERLHKLIPYDESFRMFTLPATRKGTAKVHPQLGVKINHIYYWADAFRSPEISGSQVPVRYDPFDAGIAYAYIKRHWVQCVSEHHSIFDGRSEREIQIATEILRKQRKLHNQQFIVTARKLADFLRSVEDEEQLILQQLHDAEYKQILTSKEQQNPGKAERRDENKDLHQAQAKELSPHKSETAENLDMYEDY
jgi:hypothetical protein